jgi:FtsP/CotA-like multicopper oxidase with cupredoxin domain
MEDLTMATRRAFLAGLLAAATLATTGACGSVDTVGEVDFARPLLIPPLAESSVDGEGRRVFDLVAQTGSRDFGTGDRTPTWGFNGDYLGPTLRARRGERVRVNVVNMLGEATSVHWHGMHLPARMDGGPHQEVRPGATWSPEWTVDQPAATLWYHPHPHGVTEEHVTRGLAGMFIVDEGQDVGLPRTYGRDDIPVIVQDRSFGGDGRFTNSNRGETILVNGTVGPYLDVTTGMVRLRLLNASTSRIYDFGLSDDRAFGLVGTDGGLLERPYALDRIRLSPGERAEIVVALTPGERVVLRSFPPDLGDNFFADVFGGGGGDQFDVLELRAARTLAAGADVPARLAAIDRLDPATARQTRTFRLSGTSINGERMDMGRVDEVVEVDTTEVWEVSNEDGQAHNFHVHDTQFQVVSVDGRAPDESLRGWKDTVFVAPNSTVRIVLRFTDYTDPGTPYMYHCHLLMHEDSGMMGQFVVVAPGERPTTPTAGHDHSK